MSMWDEKDPTDPKKSSRYVMPSRPSLSGKPERPLSTVRTAQKSLDRFERAPTPEEFGRQLVPSEPNSQVDSAFFESLLRRIEPEVLEQLPPPARSTDAWSRRRRFLLTMGGITVVFGIAAGAAMTFLSIGSTSSVNSAAPPTETSASSPDASKPVASQLPIYNKGDQRQESERALQQFMQWDQKSDSGQTPR